jgi:hypothetical protein
MRLLVIGETNMRPGDRIPGKVERGSVAKRNNINDNNILNGTYPQVARAIAIDIIFPHPMARLPHTVPVSQMTSFVNSARGTIMQFPTVARTTVISDRLMTDSGLTKFVATCAMGWQQNRSVAVHADTAPQTPRQRPESRPEASSISKVIAAQ